MLDRVIAYADEWMPNRIGDDDAMIARFQDLRERAAEAGRGTIPITVAGLMRDPARIERFEQAGVTRGFFWIQADDRDAVEAELDRYTAAVQAYAIAGG